MSHTTNGMTTFSVLVTLIMLSVAVGYSLLTISINTGRIDQYMDLDTQIRQKANDIVKDPNNVSLQQELADLAKLRNATRSEIEFGKRTDGQLTFLQCAAPLNPDCFHQNSSETNNLWLAMASGILGTCLFLLLGFRNNDPSQKPTIMSVVCLIPGGVIVG
jgi:uncharacterized integral membrane protein